MGRFWQGKPEEAVALIDRFFAAQKEDRIWRSNAAGFRFWFSAYAGGPDAMSLYEEVEPELFRVGRRRWVGDGLALHTAIDGLTVLGEIETAAGLYEDAVESLTLGTVGHITVPWACTTGIAAACAGEWDAAEGHFTTALQRAEEVPIVMGQFETRRWWAWMLLRCGAPDDRERAGELPKEAIAGYQKLEAPLFEQVATEMLEQARS